MPDLQGSSPQVLVTVATFGLVMSLWLIGVLIYAINRSARSRELEQRLNLGAGKQETKVLRLWHQGKMESTAVIDDVNQMSWSERIASLPTLTGWNISGMGVVMGTLGAMLLGAFASYVFTANVLTAVLAAIGIFGATWIFIQQAIAKQAQLFDSQLIDALQLAARSLRAGHPLVGAFQLISQEIQPPVATVFAEVYQQQELGLSLEEGLQRAAGRSFSQDMKVAASSIIIQLRTGGNLADMMDRLANVIRERLRLSRRVRVLTAQTQLSKRVLIVLPLLVLVLLNLINAEYMQPLYTTQAGQILLLIGAINLMAGIWLMNKIATLRY